MDQSLVDDPSLTPLDDDRLVGSLLILGIAAVALGLFIWRRWYRLPASSRSPTIESEILLLMLFALLMAMMGGAAVMASIIGGQPETLIDQVKFQLGVYAGQLVVAGLYLLVRFRRARAQQPPGRVSLGRASLLAVGGLLLFWPLVLAASLIAEFVIVQVTGEPLPHIAHKTLVALQEADRDLWFLLQCGLSVIIAPIVEEVLYRGVIQQGLRHVRLSGWTAIVVTSVIFAVMHIAAAQPHAIAALVVLSLGIGWMYEKTGRLTAPIVAHILFNAGNLVLTLLLPQ